MPKRSLLSHGRQLVRHVVPALVKPARTLWHEIIGFLFLVLAAWPIPTLVRALREFDGNPASLVRLSLTVVFVAIMGFYGISSFLRARRISRS